MPAYLDKAQISFPLNPFGVNVMLFPESDDFTAVKSMLTISASLKTGSAIAMLLETSPNRYASKNNLSIKSISSCEL